MLKLYMLLHVAVHAAVSAAAVHADVVHVAACFFSRAILGDAYHLE